MRILNDNRLKSISKNRQSPIQKPQKKPQKKPNDFLKKERIRKRIVLMIEIANKMKKI